MGISAPPVTPLLPPSEAAIASGAPFPNISGFLENPLAALYPTKEPMSAPAPGTIPIKVPIRPVTEEVRSIILKSSFVGSSLVTLVFTSSLEKISSIDSNA